MRNLSSLKQALRIPPLWARASALAVMLLCVGVFIIGFFTGFSYAPYHPEAFTDDSLSVAELTRLLERINFSFQTWINFQLVTGLIDTASYCIVGALIFVRKKQDWFGLFLSVVLFLYGTIPSYQVSILKDLFPWSYSFLQPLSVLTWAFWFIIFYLFPNGQFAPRWMRWFAAVLLFGFMVDILFYHGDTPPTWLAVVMLPGIVMPLFGQIYRYWRVSEPVERQQVKWILFAILVLGCFLLIGMLGVIFPDLMEVNSPGGMFPLFYRILISLLFPIFPLTVGLAILRYRLWDIDIIIRRTLQYSALTGLLGLAYFGSVSILQRLFTALTGQQSPAALVLSTLAIAALSTPLRRRIQDFIDQHFYRRKYDAEKALADFAAAARSEADLEQLSARLTTTVQDALQPTSLNLWLMSEVDLARRQKP